MSRVKKYRAWDERNNEMVYSSESDCFYINTKGVLFMYAIPKSESGLETIYHKSYEVDEFTGLQDKNGVDIFESDIVEWISGDENTDMGVIEWDETYAGFGITGGHCLDWNHMLTITGNIHQNPELV